MVLQVTIYVRQGKFFPEITSPKNTGISFALLKVAILKPVIIIGLVTFVLSSLGVWFGNRGGHLFEKKMEIAGGLILIGIGLKTLISHLMA